MGTLPENNACTKQAGWSSLMKDCPTSSTGPAPFHSLWPVAHSSHLLICLPHSASLCLPSAPPFLFSSRPQIPGGGGLRAGDPAAWGFRSLPSACPSLLFSFPCNSRGQLRCASKHCNHILNGNEMCELNVNYSRMEGQSLLVKV